MNSASGRTQRRTVRTRSEPARSRPRSFRANTHRRCPNLPIPKFPSRFLSRTGATGSGIASQRVPVPGGALRASWTEHLRDPATDAPAEARFKRALARLEHSPRPDCRLRHHGDVWMRLPQELRLAFKRPCPLDDACRTAPCRVQVVGQEASPPRESIRANAWRWR